MNLWGMGYEGFDCTRITFDLDNWSPLVGSLHNENLFVTSTGPVVYAYSGTRVSSLPSELPLGCISLYSVMQLDSNQGRRSARICVR